MEKEQSVLPLRKKEWIPTPLPVVYFGSKGEIVRLPFLDITKRDKVFGVAVDKVCYQAKVMREGSKPASIYKYGFLSVETELKELRDEKYPPTRGLVGRIFSAESVYARDFVVPTLDVMQKAYIQKDAFDATLQMLKDNGVAADLWADGDFICQNDEDAGCFERVIDFGAGIVKRYVAPENNAGKIMQARPAVFVKDYDPPYPIEDGFFNWKMWKECEKAL